MDEMDWSTLKKKLYHWDGSWRDIYVLDTTVEDWRKWTEFVNENCAVSWYDGKTDKAQPIIDFSVVEAYWSGDETISSTANVFIGDLQLNAHFFGPAELEMDLDPREFKSLRDHHRLLDLLKPLSTVLGREVIVTEENMQEYVLMTTKGDTVSYSF